MQNSSRRPGLFWPLLLIGLGVLWLLQNFGLLPARMWLALAQLWPVLLILLGLDMLIGRRSTAGAVVVLLLGALVVAGSLTWAALQASRLPAGEAQSVRQSMGDVKQLAVKLDLGVGNLDVSTLVDSGYLMEGEVRDGPGTSTQKSYFIQDGVGRLMLAQKQSPLFAPFAASNASTRWAIRLYPDKPLALEVNTGVGTANLDLSGLSLTTFDLNTGVGQTRVSFPAGGSVQAKVTSGIGEVILTIPPDLPARITVQSGISRVHLPARFSRAGDVYTSPGFSTDGPHLDLELTAGIGSVTVQ